MKTKSEVVGRCLFTPKMAVAIAALTILALVSPAAAQSFSDPVTYTLVGENPGRAATGDLDGDGDADIAVPTYASGSPGYVEVFLNLGDGSSAAPAANGVGNEPRSVAAADLDGDGDLDLAVANRGDGTVSVLANRGDGTFEAAVDHAAGSSPFVVVAGDLNGDGLADLAVAGQADVYWLANNGDGTFAAPQHYPFIDTIVGLDIGEIEGDTDLDLIVLEKRGGTTSTLEARVTVLWNDGSGTFEASPRYDGGSWSDAEDYALHPSVDSLALGDLNGNGYLDVLIGANTGWRTLPLDGSPLGRVNVLANSAGGLTPGEHRGSCHDDSPQLDTGDLDSNGDLDIVTNGVFFLNDGTGYFGDPQSHGGGGKYVTVDDLYPDGLPDLVLPEDPYSVRVVFQGDVCPNDPNKTDPGQCGCGQPEPDSDEDGVADCLDQCPGEPDNPLVFTLDHCPGDPNKVEPGVCGCGVPDTDSDGDGVADCLDQCPGEPDNPLVFTLDHCPGDPNKVDPGVCGCGVPDTDSDGDGVADCLDQCPGEPDNPLVFTLDHCPGDPNKVDPGVCGCGVPDTDSDGDGVADCLDQCPGEPDNPLVFKLDHCPNDPNKVDPGVCGCGVPDTDSDGDGVADCLDQCPGEPDNPLVFTLDHCPGDPNKVDPGVCGCGVPEIDSDGDRYCVTSDCDDANSGSWATPGEVAGLRFGAGTKDDLSWDVPAEPGCTASALRYDTVRSDFAGDFGAATCIESGDGSDRAATDLAIPASGSVFHYLVRAENDCPAGQGTLGHDSQGAERSAPICP